MKKFNLFSYNPPAKGVEKDKERAETPTDFLGFFKQYGRKFWNISNLNLLMAVFVLIAALGIWQLAGHPMLFYIFLGFCVILFGLFSIGTTYVVRGYVRGDPVYILSDFKYALKKNWKQGIILGIIDVLVVVLLVFDIFFWSGMDFSNIRIGSENNAEAVVSGQVLEDENEMSSLSSDAENQIVETEQASANQKEKSFIDGVFFYACLFLLVIYAFMRNYMYIIALTFKLSVFKILKNSFIFAILGIKRNIAAFFGILVVLFINTYIFVWIPMVGIALPLIITLGTCSFIGAYAAYPVIKKYMITPYYDDEEEFAEYDRIFTDRG